MSAIPITLNGTIATAPVCRTLPSGRACASFRLAVNHWKLDKDSGEFTNDATSWFSVDCYGALATNTAVSIKPGMSIIVTGNLRIRQWETAEKNGVAPTVIAEHIGPDLRHGTANYQRAKGADPSQNQSSASSGAADGSQGSVWSALDEPAPARHGAEGVESADRAGASDGPGASDGSGASDGAEESGGAEAESGGEDTIARDTADAAAPF